MKYRFWLLVLVPPVIALGLVWPSAFAKVAQESPSFIDAPDRWVPFEAEVLRTHADGPVVRGRYYRSSDGSYRAESGPALDDIRVIFIANFVMGLYYDWNSARGDGWAMEEAPHLAEPLYAEPTRMRADLSSRKLHPQPLPLRKGESDETGATSGGFEAYEADLGDGATGFMVPALNFFTVILTRPDGSYEKFYNVDLVEPDPALFRPPAGATITSRAPTHLKRALQLSQDR